MKWRLLCIAVFSIGLMIGVSASAERLLSPWDSSRPWPTAAPYSCPAPTPFRRVLDLQGYYTDKQYSVVDPKRLAAFNQASAGPTHLGQYVTSAAYT